MQTVYSRPSPDLTYYKAGSVVPLKVSGNMGGPKNLHLMVSLEARKNVTTYGTTPSGDYLEPDDEIRYDSFTGLAGALQSNITHTIYGFGDVPGSQDKSLLMAFQGRGKNIRSEIGADLKDSSKQLVPDYTIGTLRLLQQVETPANPQKGTGIHIDIPLMTAIDMCYDEKGRPSSIPFNKFPVHDINITLPPAKLMFHGADMDSDVQYWITNVEYKYDIDLAPTPNPLVRIYSKFTGLANSLIPQVNVNSNIVADSIFMGFIPESETGTYTYNDYRMARLPDWRKASFSLNGDETFKYAYELNTEADLLYQAQLAINGNTGNTSLNMEMLQRGDTTSDGFIVGTRYNRPVDLRKKTAGVRLECGPLGPTNIGAKKYIVRGYVGGFMSLVNRK